jgi:hypothetical protein
MCTVVLSSVMCMYIYIYICMYVCMYIYLYLCLFYDKVMNKNVKCWRVGTCQNFLEVTYSEALLLDLIVTGNKL